MRWVVIGSSGYIGSALCQHLVELGFDVLSISRRSNGPAGCGHLQLAEFSTPAFENIFQPGDRVVYAAGVASVHACRKYPQRAEWLNSELPCHLLATADSAAVASFLYLSSVKARSAPSGVIACEGCGEPARDVYGQSKWQAEQKLLSLSVNCRLNILRPAAVYGSRHAEQFPHQAKRTHKVRQLLRRWGSLFPWAPATGFRSMISLPDLLDAVCLIEKQQCDREIFIAAEPCFYDSVAMIAAASGGKVRSSRLLTAMMLWPFRFFRNGGFAARLLELERSELYSAGRLRSRLDWRAKNRYQDFLRGC